MLSTDLPVSGHPESRTRVAPARRRDIGVCHGFSPGKDRNAQTWPDRPDWVPQDGNSPAEDSPPEVAFVTNALPASPVRGRLRRLDTRRSAVRGGSTAVRRRRDGGRRPVLSAAGSRSSRNRGVRTPLAVRGALRTPRSTELSAVDRGPGPLRSAGPWLRRPARSRKRTPPMRDRQAPLVATNAHQALADSWLALWSKQ